MKVALAFPGCHRRGGVERIMLECARYLVGAGHDVHVFASEFDADREQDGFQHHVVTTGRRPRFLRGAAFYRACSSQLAEFDYDVLNTHGCVCPVGGVQWVQSVHAAWLDRSRRFRPPLSLAGIKQRLNPLHPVLLRLEAAHFGARRYRKLIATTEQVRTDLQSYYDVPPEDVDIVPNGFSPSEFSPALRAQRREEVRERLGLREDEVVILFAANELERKGYRVLLAALRALGRRDVRLLVVGRPPQAEVMRWAADVGLGEVVIACGATSNVAEFHAAADLFVLPTQYEAFCLAILEALGSGLPVITTAVPGARDAMTPNVNGLVVDDPLDSDEFAQAIQVGLDRSIRDRWSAAAPASVVQYQWPTVLARYERILLNYRRPSATPTTAIHCSAGDISPPIRGTI